MNVEIATATGLAMMAAGEVPNYLAGALPSFMTIGRFAAEDEDRKMWRFGEIYGGSAALLVGVGASLVVQSWWPIIGTIVVLAYLLYGYEVAIRHAQKRDDIEPINAESNK